MQSTKTFLQTWKHDIIAGSFSVLAMVLLLQLMSRGSSQVVAETPAATSPASFSIVTETSDASDELARTGETSQHAKAQPLPTEDNQEQPTEQATQDVTQTPESRQGQPATEQNQAPVTEETATAKAATESESAQAATKTAENVTAQEDIAGRSTEQTDQHVTKTDSRSQPNDVEAKPKPVEQMTAEEIAEAVAAYEQRVRNGEVRLVLEWVLSPDQLNSVVAYYVVATKYTAIAVTAGGSVDYITAENSIPKGKLIGDLPNERSKWPPALVSVARHRLGSTYVSQNTNFVLSDATALKLYRTLASDVGTNDWRPGSEFVLRLFDSGGEIQVKLVRRWEPAKSGPLIN
jgi:hypothetical protein